jgi:eukaryotic-like serine/threonine-protein kinase
MIGRVLNNKYRIIRELAIGGMSTVYLAEQISSGADVAVKVLKKELQADEKYLRRFRREAQASMALNHPNIVKMHDIGRDGDDYYLVMEYIPLTLKDLIARKGKLEHKEAVNIASQVCDALKCAHALGIIHRDIKPQNILITEEGIAKVADFGIARDISSHTGTMEAASAIGSVHYISPEQATGHHAERSSDIYSLGITLFEMVTGDVPFTADTGVAVAIKHVSSALPLPISIVPQIPQALNDIILKATLKLKTSRYQTADAMKKDMLRSLKEPEGNFVVMAETSPTTHFSPVGMQKEAGKGSRSNPKRRLRWVLLITVVSTLVIAAVLTSVFLVQSSLFTSANNTETGVMPKLTGITESEAVSLLTEREINYEIERQANDTVPEGMIISQDPEPQKAIEKGKTVKFIVSLGPASLFMPNLTGMTLADAEKTIEEAGLVTGAIEYQASDKPDGYVLNQEPQQDATVSKGDTVNLWISGIGNPTVYQMPSLTGMSLEEAKENLNGAGFKWIRIREEKSTQPEGEILRQQPEPNTTLAPTSVPVQLWISAQVSKSYFAMLPLTVNVEAAKSQVLIVLVENDLEYVVFEQEEPKGELKLDLKLTSSNSIEKTVKVFVNGREAQTTTTPLFMQEDIR